MDWRVRAGVLAAAYVGAVLALTTLGGLPAFAMSFASSSILLAAQPDSAAARPRSLIGGHLLAAICGWVVGALAGDAVWAPGCVAHTENLNLLSATTVAGVSMKESLDSWYFGGNVAPRLVDTCRGVNCGSGCPASAAPQPASGGWLRQ